MCSLKDTTTHVVVQFINEEQNGKLSIELVPRSWLKFTDIWMCYFPPKEEFPNVAKWVKNSKSPQRNWDTSEVHILKQADSYEKGNRRLEKAYFNLEKCSTGEETDVASSQSLTNNMVVFDGEVNVLAALEDIPIFIPDASTSTVSAVPDNLEKGKRGLGSATVDMAKTRRNELPDINNLMRMITDRFERCEMKMKEEIDSAKRSILYDLHKSICEIKNTIVLNSHPPLGTLINEYKTDLAVTLPFQTLEAFIEFDEISLLDPKKEKSLKALMTTQATGIEVVSQSISAILIPLLSKSVQLEYTACGRESNGNKKRSFRNTRTFSCMRDVVCEKYSVSEKEVVSKMSRWFTGATDRQGGRKQRNRPK